MSPALTLPVSSPDAIRALPSSCPHRASSSAWNGVTFAPVGPCCPNPSHPSSPTRGCHVCGASLDPKLKVVTPSASLCTTFSTAFRGTCRLARLSCFGPLCESPLQDSKFPESSSFTLLLARSRPLNLVVLLVDTYLVAGTALAAAKSRLALTGDERLSGGTGAYRDCGAGPMPTQAGLGFEPRSPWSRSPCSGARDPIGLLSAHVRSCRFPLESVGSLHGHAQAEAGPRNAVTSGCLSQCVSL